MTQVDVIIIGAGLFGSTTAKYMRSKGLTTCVVDSKHPMGASKCSFSVWKEGWVGSSIKEMYAISLPILQELYEITDIKFFNMKKERFEDFKAIKPTDILNETSIDLEVATIKNDSVTFTNGTRMAANLAVVVCAGVQTPAILKSSGYDAPEIDSYWGATLNVSLTIEEGRMLEWAPYKQCMAVKTEEGFVFGDGASVKNPTSMDKRIENVSLRLVGHLNDVMGTNVNPDNITFINEGCRPYLKKGVSLVNTHDSKLISATGGAKNSTILSGYVAAEVYKIIMDK